ncbi:MAG: peptide chain release factor 1 [Planctomycetota bacterium]|nr:peptide chain release factor 1 [Planctomycetota bacterium]
MPPLQDTLIAKLEELERRYDGLLEQMNDPAVAANHVRMADLAREQSHSRQIVELFRRYRKLASDRDGAQAILNDPTADADFKALASGELDGLRHAAADALEEIKGLLVMGDEQAIDSIVLEIRAGTGGAEAALFTADLLDMYRRYVDRQGWSFEVMSASPTEMGGYREVIAGVRGAAVWSRLGYEGGGHRVQRVPKTESQGRIHTSAATVAVLPEPKNIEVDINWEKDVNEFTSRSSGPGGQNVNKVESAIKLVHIPTGISVSMQDEKSQHKNRAKARRILAVRVFEFHESRARADEAAARKTMIGSGDRSQRIRTYNYPQNRCTDHRLRGEGQEGANFNLDRVLDGDMDDLIEALIARDRAERLANL